MGLFDTVKLKADLPLSFEDDGYELTPEMKAKYLESILSVSEGQMRAPGQYFCKNGSIFDVDGNKLTWGDITPEDVRGMKGVYYILSENKSYWNPEQKSVHRWNFDEPVAFDPRYVKRNAIARIVDGEIQTSEDLIQSHYS